MNEIGNEFALFPDRFSGEPPLEDGRRDALEDPPPIQPGSKLWQECRERIRRSIEGGDKMKVDIFQEEFESTLRDLAILYRVQSKSKGGTWEGLELRHLLGKFSDAIPAFWNQCPDREKGMLAEIQEVILVALRIAERLKPDGD